MKSNAELWELLKKIRALKKLWDSAVGLPIGTINLKDEILYITFCHPAHLSEWRMGEERYMKALREEYRRQGLKKIVVFKKIVCQKKHINKKEQERQTSQTYQERARGDFKNLCKNPSIHKILENIRETIRSKNDTQTEKLS